MIEPYGLADDRLRLLRFEPIEPLRRNEHAVRGSRRRARVPPGPESIARVQTIDALAYGDPTGNALNGKRLHRRQPVTAVLCRSVELDVELGHRMRVEILLHGQQVLTPVVIGIARDVGGLRTGENIEIGDLVRD